MASLSLEEKVINKLKEQTKSRGEYTLKSLPHPFTLHNNEKAADRIIENLLSGKRMLIIGDYDADGIMATTILMRFFNALGFGVMVDYKIPDRITDGYGLNPKLIDYALENGFDFAVTVDNGIAANKAMVYANEKGFEVIITDHHTAPKILPKCEIIVNPRSPEDKTFPYEYISGATVAWYLAYAIKIKMGFDYDMTELLDYVALTIISDVMPLENVNVPIVEFGIREIKKRKRVIYNHIWNDWTAPVIDTTGIAFLLVPMINAIGRIDDANKAVKIFLEDDPTIVAQYYQFMLNTNEKRKELSREYLQIADSLVVDNNAKVIVVRQKDFHEGLVGIVAGKLAERYHKPAYVFGYNEEKGIWKGSGRTVGNIHLYDLTNRASNNMLGFGGHSGAVGLSVLDENFENMTQDLIKEADLIPDEDFIDAGKEPIECNLDEITPELMNKIMEYAPFGAGNPLPLFKTNSAIIIERKLKNGLHFKCNLVTDKTTMTGLFFNVKEDEFVNKIGDNCNYTFTLGLSYDLKSNFFNIEANCESI